MKWRYYKHERLSLVTLYRIIYKRAVPFCSDLRDGVNCRMPQSVRNGGITFRWEEVMQTVPRMATLFKEFLLNIASSQLKRLNLTESEGSVVW